MKIKRLSFFLFSFLFTIVSLSAQTKTALEDKAQSNCEELIFNTRELTPFEFNERCRTESYPFISDDGRDLYYTHDQAYDWIFYSQREQSTGKWTVPVPLSISNFKKEIRSCYLSKDKEVLYFTSEGKLFKCYAIDSSRTAFNQVQEIEINMGSINAGPASYLSFTQDFSRMYAMVYSAGKSVMCEYVLAGDNVYTYIRTISNTKGELGTISNNGLIYYYTNDEFPNLLFCRKRSAIKEDFGVEVYLARKFESQLDVGHVRFAEKAGLMTLVLSESVWEKNDLFFTNFDASDTANNFPEFDITNFRAQSASARSSEKTLREVTTTIPVKKREIINSKGNESCKIELGQTFPNPTRNTFFFYYNITSDDLSLPGPVVKVLDNAGRVVYSGDLEDFKGEAKIILDDVPAGQYMVKVEYNGFSSELIRISINQ